MTRLMPFLQPLPYGLQNKASYSIDIKHTCMETLCEPSVAWDGSGAVRMLRQSQNNKTPLILASSTSTVNSRSQSAVLPDMETIPELRENLHLLGVRAGTAPPL